MRGVVYIMVGDVRYAFMAMVSMYSLRRFYAGPITVLHSENLTYFAELMTRNYRLAPSLKTICPLEAGANSGYLTKSTLHRYLPYDANVLLDADTTVHGPIDHLFPTNRELVLTLRCARYSQKTHLERQLREWEYSAPYLVFLQRQYDFPAINAGVMGLPRKHPALPYVEDLCQKNATAQVPDEMATQLLYPHHPYRLLGQAFNQWPLEGSPHTNAVIYHYYSKALHYPEARRMFMPLLFEVLKWNIARVNQWKGTRSIIASLFGMSSWPILDK